MADVFKTPGVYVKEIPSFPPSIAEVETAIPAFIGYTLTDTFNGRSLNLKPTRITSLLEYEQFFGGAQRDVAITVSIKDVTAAGVLTSRSITAASNPTRQSRFKMYYSLQMYFANGGGPCYIVSVGTYPAVPATAPSDGDVTKDAFTKGLDEIAKFDEPTLLVFPDSTALADHYEVMEKALKQCRDLQDRFTIIDVKHVTGGTNEINDSVDALRNSTQLGNNLDELKYGAAYFPNLETTLNYRYDDADVSVVYVKDGTTITEAGPEDADASTDVLNFAQIKNPPADINTGIRDGLGLTKNGTVTGNTELYNNIKLELNKVTVVLPPSSAVAGVYAAVDSSRGVWKAPANVSLAGVNAATIKISHQDQMSMNVDPVSGKSVNAIRYFTGKGLLVWGARTLAGNDNEWRYVPVRRFFNFAEESIKKGSEWVVFEPNDANTWVRVKAMIENFLIKQWRAGALAGVKPEHAFFVNVGLGVTMTAVDILEGRMIIEIGMAVVRPAEFIILKFSHKMQES